MSRTRKDTQYFELVGDRAIWQRGWKAVTRHPKGSDFDADRWELYHVDQDFAELTDLASAQPDKLRRLIELWWSEAGKYTVLPLDDRDWERAAERLKMNPTTRYEYMADMARIDRLSAPDISDRAYTVTASFEADRDRQGVILAWGSLFGGFVIYLKDGRLCYEYVFSEIDEARARCRFSASNRTANDPAEAGAHELTGASGQPECRWNARGRHRHSAHLADPWHHGRADLRARCRCAGQRCVRTAVSLHRPPSARDDRT